MNCHFVTWIRVKRKISEKNERESWANFFFELR